MKFEKLELEKYTSMTHPDLEHIRKGEEIGWMHSNLQYQQMGRENPFKLEDILSDLLNDINNSLDKVSFLVTDGVAILKFDKEMDFTLLNVMKQIAFAKLDKEHKLVKKVYVHNEDYMLLLMGFGGMQRERQLCSKKTPLEEVVNLALKDVDRLQVVVENGMAQARKKKTGLWSKIKSLFKK